MRLLLSFCVFLKSQRQEKPLQGRAIRSQTITTFICFPLFRSRKFLYCMMHSIAYFYTCNRHRLFQFCVCMYVYRGINVQRIHKLNVVKTLKINPWICCMHKKTFDLIWEKWELKTSKKEEKKRKRIQNKREKNSKLTTPSLCHLVGSNYSLEQ